MNELLTEVPLQAIDNVLRQFNAGQLLLGATILAIIGTLPLKSLKATALTVITFGAILVVTPTSLAGGEIAFRLVGIGMLVVGPMLYVTGRR